MPSPFLPVLADGRVIYIHKNLVARTEPSKTQGCTTFYLQETLTQLPASVPRVFELCEQPKQQDDSRHS